MLAAVYARACGTSSFRYRFEQPVHQGDVAEPVRALPVDAVRLEGVEPVGGVDHDVAASLADAQCVFDRPPVVGDMFDHLVEDQHVEGAVPERQALGGRGQQPGHALRALDQAFDFHVDPVHMRTERPEPADVRPDPGPDVEDPGVFELHVAPDQLEAALLAGAPHVARLAAQRGFG